MMMMVVFDRAICHRRTLSRRDASGQSSFDTPCRIGLPCIISVAYPDYLLFLQHNNTLVNNENRLSLV